ncbi:Hypothetical predicted protein, partial [Mytilus galloprovincialis]
MGDNSGKVCIFICALLIGGAILIAVLVGTSLKKLATGEVGIKYDTFQRDLGTETLREGLHQGPPGYEFIIFPSTYKSLTFDDLE